MEIIGFGLHVGDARSLAGLGGIVRGGLPLGLGVACRYGGCMFCRQDALVVHFGPGVAAVVDVAVGGQQERQCRQRAKEIPTRLAQ